MKRRTLIQCALAQFPLARPARATADPVSWEAVMAQKWEAPAELRSFAGVRPRLFVTGKRIADLKRQITTSHKDVWEIIQENAGRYLGKATPSNFKSEGAMRGAGRGVPWQALAYLITNDAAYFQGARKWMLTICGFPQWEQNNSLSGGECLFGVATGYDWLHDQLDSKDRAFIRDKLVDQARAMKPRPVHHDRWLANHNHVEHLGLAAAGFALFDEIPEAIEWIRQADLVFGAMLRMSGGDGGSTEGHQYWAYTTEAFLRYAELARDLLGQRLYGHQWVKSVPDFILHSSLPGFTAENCVMSFGDSHREYSSHGPAHILYRLAAEHKNSHAQWLAQEMQRRRVGRTAYCTWANLLWYDDSVRPLGPAGLPTFKHCQDIGWVTARSGWEEDAVMVGFKCGPMHGHKAQEYYDTHRGLAHDIGGGHGHPDVNSFQIYAHGKWLAIDPGYERPKWTRNHNTLLVNGHGQLGEGDTWFDRDAVLEAGAGSAIVKTEHAPGFDYVVGDAKNVYPREAGLETFRRHFLYVRPDFVVVADELKAGSPAVFEWLLHTDVAVEGKEPRMFVVRNGEVLLDVHLLLPLALEARVRGKTLTVATERTADPLILTVLHPRRVSDPVSSVQLAAQRGPRLEIVLRSPKLLARVELDITARRVSLANL